MIQSDSIAALAAALVKAQAAMLGAKKGGTNPHFRSKYSDLADCWDACREPLTANGLAVLQPVSTLPGAAGEIGVTTMLVHESGEWISETLHMRPVKDDPQGRGSAITYARRYGLCAMVGIAPEDDDGEAAMGDRSAPQKPAQAKPAGPPPTAGASRVVKVTQPTGKGPGRVELVNAAGDVREFKAWPELLAVADKYGKVGTDVYAAAQQEETRYKDDGSAWPTSYMLTVLSHLKPKTKGAASDVASDMAKGATLGDNEAPEPPDVDLSGVPF